MGTADGNLAIFEDKSVKVNIEHILHQNLNCFMFIHQHPPSDYKLLDPRIMYSVFYLFIASESLVHNRFSISTC